MPGYFTDYFTRYFAVGAFARVVAVRGGQYAEIWRDVGDVFDIENPSDFSDSAVNYGSSATPWYGWMEQVPYATPLFSFALARQGASTVVQSVPQYNVPRGPAVYSIRQYVV